MGVFVHHVHVVPMETRREHRIPLELELHMVGYLRGLGIELHLEEHPVLLTIKQSLKPLN